MVRFISIIILLLIVSSCNETANNYYSSENSLLYAVPLNSGLIIETNDYQELYTNIYQNNQIWNDLHIYPAIKSINSVFRKTDSLCVKNSYIKDLIENKTVNISVHHLGRDNVAYLFLIGIVPSNFEELTKQLLHIFTNSYKFSSKQYSDHNIGIISENDSRDKLFYSISSGLIIMSRSEILVEMAIRQSSSKYSLLTDDDFREVAQTAGKNVLANVYINYEEFIKLSKHFLNDHFYTQIAYLKHFARWSALDLTVKDKEILLNGFTISSSTNECYTSAFKEQKNITFKSMEAIPSNVQCFTLLGMPDIKLFRKRYKNYLQNTSKLLAYKRNIEILKKELGINYEKLFYDFMGDELSLVVTQNGTQAENFVLVKTTNGTQAEKNLREIVTAYTTKKEKNINDFMTQNNAVNSKIYTIYKMPIKNLFSSLFGDLFRYTVPRYFVVYQNYVIFGKSEKMLSKYLHYLVTSKSFDKRTDFKHFYHSLSEESTIIHYSEVAYSSHYYSSILNNSYRKKLNAKFSAFNNVSSFTIQFTNEQGLFYSNAVLKYRQKTAQKKLPRVWETALDTTLRIKPQLFTNHYTQATEIVVQDMQNKIYLIDNNGNILWKKQLPEAIKSDIFSIDFYKNEKYQLLFNSENYMYLIDRNGENVENYPIKLISPATNAMNVFDYEDTKDYRLFVCGQDKKIYAYTQEGVPVEGWNQFKTNDFVYNPIQYSNIAGLDYILAGDLQRIYILNRRGEERIDLDYQFSKSLNNKFQLDFSDNKPRWLTTGTGGTLIFIYQSGRVNEMEVNAYSSNHFFEYNDIDNDKHNEYIFLDNRLLEVYDDNRKKLFSHNFKYKIFNAPTVFHFSKTNTKIGIVSGASNQAYLFDYKGTITEGFPVNGNTAFTITRLYVDKPSFYMLIGSDDSFLYCYKLNE